MKLLLLAGIALAAYAAPITSGTVNFAVATPTTFQIELEGNRLTGSGFGVFSDSVMDCRFGCPLGFEVAAAFHVCCNDFGGGTAEINGVSTPVGWAWMGAPGSYFIATGPSMTIQGAGILTSTFSLTGQLCGQITGQPMVQGQCPVWYTDIIGSGTVSVTIIEVPATQFQATYYRSTSATFTFTETPEPSSMLLISAGLAGVAFLRRRG